MPQVPAISRCSAPSRSANWLAMKLTTAWATVIRRVVIGGSSTEIGADSTAPYNRRQMTRADEILERLEKLGLRQTGPRRAIVESVCSREGSFTTQEIADDLVDRGIGRATVFRAIGTLQELGYLSRLHVGE